MKSNFFSPNVLLGTYMLRFWVAVNFLELVSMEIKNKK
jgi:hypothetical protein